MNISKLLDIESRQGFEDVNAIRESGIPSFLDEWVVLGLLGRGACGNVYRIAKPQEGMTTQECALKICPVITAEDADLRRQEVETQQLLKGHPNAVQIEDYAVISREPPRMSYMLIRMELLKPMPSDGLSETEVTRLGMDICSVLEKCASLQPKLVHCDIKPANILMTQDGRYKLGDFGMAKTMQASMTYTGNRGTPLYMAPEVASFTGYDGRCDIFSLGYTMLTMLNGGEHIYSSAGERTDILRMMYTPGTRHRIRGVSAGLMKIIGRMCQPNLNARYSRASMVRRDLERFVKNREEAERNILLRAERMAEQSKSQSKARHEKEEKLAQNALDRARSDLDRAMSSSKSGRRKDDDTLRNLGDSVDRAARIRQYVSDGLSYKAARLKLAVNSGESGVILNGSAGRKKRFAIFGAAILFLTALCVVGFLMGSGGEQHTSDDQTVTAISVDELLYEEINDGKEYRVIGTKNKRATLAAIPFEYNGKLVTEIGSEAFRGNKNLRKVTMESNVTEIGDMAFMYCTSLKEVVFSDNIERIGESAFKGCESIRKIDLPDKLKYVGAHLFEDCVSLERVETSNINNMEFSPYMFANCSSLFEIGIPCNDKIGEYAFYKCSSLRRINIYSMYLEEIGDFAFASCTDLTWISLQETIRRVGNSAFKNCTSLVYVDIAEGLKTIGEEAFKGCVTLEKISMPNSLREIGKDAFIFTGEGFCVYAPHKSSYYCDERLGENIRWEYN